MSSFTNLKRSEIIAFVFLSMTIVLPLSAFWIIISLFCNKEFKACDSISVKLFLGLFLLDVSNEENAGSNNLDFMDSRALVRPTLTKCDDSCTVKQLIVSKSVNIDDVLGGRLKMPAGYNSRLACARNLKFSMEVALNKAIKTSC